MNIIGINNGNGVQKMEPIKLETATRTAVLFLLDESSSMDGKSIENLNAAINRFPHDVCDSNGFARTNIEIAIMAFSTSVRLVADWKPLGKYVPVSLSANGGTDIDIAMKAALKKIEEKLNNSSYKTAHIVLISDGYGGDVSEVAKEIARMKKDGKLVFWMLGVPGYDSATAQALTQGDHLYTLSDGKQFDYSDFIKILVGSVAGQSTQKPELKKPEKIKTIGIKGNGSNQSGNGFLGDFFSK